MQNVLVTGGAGYIGVHTCSELLNAGFGVISIDNYCNSSPLSLERLEKISKKKIIKYEGDVRNKTLLKRIFHENKIDSVIHFAGLKAVGESCKFPLDYYDNNINGIISLCQVMAENNVKKIVFSSSATVYGDNIPPYSENMTPGEVTNPYGRTKLISEQILTDLFNSDNSWSVIVLRYFNPIGAHQSGLLGEDPSGIPNNIMPFISKVALGSLPELTVFGNDYDTPDGTCIRDYIHVVDLALGHICAVNKALSENGLYTYNLGTGTGYSVLELINTFERVTGQKVKYKIGPRREGDLPICYANTDKASKELKWQTKYGLEKMCEDTWRWQKQNPFGYK